MKASKVIGFNASKMASDMMDVAVDAIGGILVEYAKDKVLEIANRIKSTGYKMDRTGNLLDSLCWFVSYRGKLLGSGFYRGQSASKNSYLHELFSSDIREMFPVHGHALAEMFIADWGKKSYDGWCVAFAILAPYWGYWEQGHDNKLTGKYERFAIMAEIYDEVNRELKPSGIRFYRSRHHYTIDKLNKMFKNMQKSVYKEKRHYSKWPSHIR
jgi:hypothetical protein